MTGALNILPPASGSALSIMPTAVQSKYLAEIAELQTRFRTAYQAANKPVPPPLKSGFQKPLAPWQQTQSKIATSIALRDVQDGDFTVGGVTYRQAAQTIYCKNAAPYGGCPEEPIKGVIASVVFGAITAGVGTAIGTAVGAGTLGDASKSLFQKTVGSKLQSEIAEDYRVPPPPRPQPIQRLPAQESADSGDGLSDGATVGIIVGAGVLLFLLVK